MFFFQFCHPFGQFFPLLEQAFLLPGDLIFFQDFLIQPLLAILDLSCHGLDLLFQSLDLFLLALNDLIRVGSVG